MISIILFIVQNLITSLFSKETLNIDISESPISLILNSTLSNYSYNVQAFGKSNYLNFVFNNSQSHVIKYIVSNNINENISGFFQYSGNIIIPYAFHNEKLFEINLECLENCLSNISIYFEEKVTLEPMSSNTFKIHELYGNNIIFKSILDNESFIYMKSLEKNEINLLVNNSNCIINNYFDIIYYQNNASDKIGQTDIKIEFKINDTIKLVSTSTNDFISIDQSKSYLDRYFFMNNESSPLTLEKKGLTIDIRTRCDSNAKTWETYYGTLYDLEKYLAISQSYFLSSSIPLKFRIRSSNQNEIIMCNLQTAIFDNYDKSYVSLNNALKPNMTYLENIESRNSSINYEFKTFMFERSKYKYNKYIINVSDYKYKTKYSKSNISKVYMHKCNNFPFCYYDINILKNLEETGQIKSYNKKENSFIFSFLLNETNINYILIVYSEIQSMFTINISEVYIPEPEPDPAPTQEPIKSDNDTNPENQKNDGLSSKSIGLIIGLVVPGALIIAGLIYFFVRRNRLRKNNDLENNWKIEYVD